MINLEYQLVAYHDNQLNRYWLTKPKFGWLTKKLQQKDLKVNNNLTQIVTKDLSQRFDQITITKHQVQFNFPQIIDQEFVLPVIIYLTQEQAQSIIENNNSSNGKFFNDQQIPNNLPKHLKNDNQDLKMFLNDDLQAHALKNIHYLLPKTFTAKQLSALLTIITGRFIKRNNIRRDFLNQTKIVGKDHSHAGYPSNLFQYNNKSFNIKDKPKLKGPHKI